MATSEVESLIQNGIDAHCASLTTHAGFRFGHGGFIYALDHLVRDADIVHLHYPFFGTAGLIAGLKRKGKVKKLVVTLHMDAAATGLKGLIFDLHRKLFQRGVLYVADVLIASSSDYARNSSFAPWADRIIELPFGVDETRFVPSANRDVSRPFTALFVGGMDRAHAFKGVKVLLEAISRVSNIKAKLIGDGDLRSSYESLARRLSISDRVSFLGKLSPDELPSAYQSSDVLVLPSLSGAEAFGLVALEAQSSGVPVIASDLPGVRTVVADGESGILVPCGDVEALVVAIKRLESDKELRANMGLAGRKRVLERFTWGRHVKGLLDIYRSI
jgi:glycosyltransferase involved in cell wall biosynthesis